MVAHFPLVFLTAYLAVVDPFFEPPLEKRLVLGAYDQKAVFASGNQAGPGSLHLWKADIKTSETRDHVIHGWLSPRISSWHIKNGCYWGSVSVSHFNWVHLVCRQPLPAA